MLPKQRVEGSNPFSRSNHPPHGEEAPSHRTEIADLVALRGGGVVQTSFAPCRGSNPGDTGETMLAYSAFVAAQRRPGFEPRRHMTSGYFDRGIGGVAQRRPGFEPRRHPRCARPAHCFTTPLNEGRGSNPGDTSYQLCSRSGQDSAQRRPGFEPRRHASSVQPVSAHPMAAQRRPGFEPRRHECRATRTRSLTGPLNEGRGSNPGDTT